LLFGLPLLGTWLWFATQRGLAPLDGIAREIAARARTARPAGAAERDRALAQIAAGAKRAGRLVDQC